MVKEKVMKSESVSVRSITRSDDSGETVQNEFLAVEAPLEIGISCRSENKTTDQTISITMRTPGDDTELAAGFLFTEGMVTELNQIKSITQPSAMSILATFTEDVKPDLEFPERNFMMNASCGVCGKSNISHISRESTYSLKNDILSVSSEVLFTLPDILNTKQTIFSHTGGLHASALFSAQGDLLILFEDIGRHNALDKVIGYGLLKGMLPFDNHILFLSGRAGFELIQKAYMAGIRFIVAIGAPSDLAVSHAESKDITLVGFLRKNRMNVYCGQHRICFKKSTT